MATLTVEQKVKIRRAIARKAAAASVPVSWSKAAVNDSAQAVDDILASAAFQTSISDDIDAASTPHGITFTNAEKKWIAAMAMELNYTKDILG